MNRRGSGRTARRHGLRLAVALGTLLCSLLGAGTANAALTTLFSTIVGTPTTSGVNNTAVGPAAGYPRASDTTNFRAAMAFTPTTSGIANLLSMRGQCVIYGTACQSIGQVSIQTDAGGQPSGVVLGTMGFYLSDALGLPATAERECGTLSPAPVLTAGTRYWAVMTAPNEIGWNFWSDAPGLVLESTSLNGGAFSAWSAAPTQKTLALRLDWGATTCLPVAVPNPASGTTLTDMYVHSGQKAFNTVTISNTGVAPLTLGSATFSGADASVFSVMNQEPGPLASPLTFPRQVGVGSLQFLYVTCTGPTTERWYRASLTVATSDPSHPSLTYPVECLVDNTPPTLTFGQFTPTGQNGWFVVAPATGNVVGHDPESGDRVINITCNDTNGPTQVASASVLRASLTAEGIHNLSCTATDLARNTTPAAFPYTVKVDTRPPTVQPTVTPAPNAAGWNNTLPVGVAFTCVDPTPGSGVATPAGGAATISAETAGTNVTSTGCTDLAGLASVAVTTTVRADTHPPVTTLTVSPPTPNGDNGFYVTPVHVTAAATDALSGIAATRCRLDGVAPTQFTDLPASACAYGGAGADVAADGQHSVYASSIDVAGNADAAIRQTAFKIDRTPPTVTAASAAPAAIPAGAVSTVSFAANESGQASLRLTNCSTAVLATAAYAASGTATLAVSASALSEGPNTVAVCVRDAAGNTGSRTVQITKDTIAPTLTSATAAPLAIGTGASSTVVFAANEGGQASLALASCSGTLLATAAYTAPGSASLSLASADLAEGPNTVAVCVRDAVGNTGSRTITVTKDTVAPIVTAASAAPAAIAAGGTSTVTLAASENGQASLRLTDCSGTLLAGGAYTAPANATLAVTAPNLTEGPNTVAVCVRDAAGNTGSRTVTIIKDTIAPTVTAASAAPSTIAAGGTSTVTLAASENGQASLRLTDCTGTLLASGAYTAPGNATLAVAASDLTEGASTVAVCVRDAAGNTGSRTVTVIKDTGAPTVMTASAAPTAIAAGTRMVIFAASENGQASLRLTDCSGALLASGPYTAPGDATLAIATADLNEGSNDVAVCVTDAAGNTGSRTVTITKDTVTPTVTTASVAPAAIGAGASTTVTFAASEDGQASLRLTDCSGAVVASRAYSAPGEATLAAPEGALAEGPNTVAVCVTDAAGNTGSRTVTITKDTVAPTVTAASAAPAEIGAGGTSTATFAASEDGQASLRLSDCSGTVLASGAYTATGNATLDAAATGLTDGSNTVAVCVVDAAGNTGSRTVTITKNTSAPTVTSASAAPAAIGADGTSTVTFAADEGGQSSVHATDCSGSLIGGAAAYTAPGDATLAVPATALGEGANTLAVCVQDALGNTGSHAVVITKDTAAPAVTAATAPATIPAGGASTVTFSATENGQASVRATNCAGSLIVGPTAYTAPGDATLAVPASSLAAGANTVAVCVQDGVGNTGSHAVVITRESSAVPRPTSPGGTVNPEPGPTGSIAGISSGITPGSCAQKPFRVTVRGRGIIRTVFSVDGKVVKRVGTTNAPSVAVDPAKVQIGMHRVKALLSYADAGIRPQTLSFAFRRCGAQIPSVGRFGECVNVRVTSSRPGKVAVSVFSGPRSALVFGGSVYTFRAPGTRVVCLKIPVAARGANVRGTRRFTVAIRVGGIRSVGTIRVS